MEKENNKMPKRKKILNSYKLVIWWLIMRFAKKNLLLKSIKSLLLWASISGMRKSIFFSSRKWWMLPISKRSLKKLSNLLIVTWHLTVSEKWTEKNFQEACKKSSKEMKTKKFSKKWSGVGWKRTNWSNGILCWGIGCRADSSTIKFSTECLSL